MRLKCFHNVNFIPGGPEKVPFVGSTFSQMYQKLERALLTTDGIIGLDLETFASPEKIGTRQEYLELREFEYIEEGKNPTLKSAQNKFNKEFSDISKEIALDPNQNSIRLIQINTSSEVLIFDCLELGKREVENLFKLIMKFAIVGQNIKFDVKSIKAKYEWFEPVELFDTMIANKIIRVRTATGRFKSDLGSIIKHWLDIELEKEHGGSGWGSIISQSMLEYAYLDVLYLFDLLYMMINKLNNDSVSKVGRERAYFKGKLFDRVSIIEMRFLYPLCQTEIKGIPININYLKGEKRKLEKTVRELEKPFASINYKSPNQLKEFLFDHEIYVESTGRPVLVRHKHHEIVKQLLDLKEAVKLLQMVEDYIEKWADSGRVVYSNFNQLTGAAGRMSSTAPNMQQIPYALKENIYAARKGKRIFKADYPSIEARVAGFLTRDPKIIEIFSADETTPVHYRDMHFITSAEFFGIDPADVTKDQRKSGKSANFGLMFGMGVQAYIDYSFQNFGLDIDEDEARRQRKLYFNLYKGIAQFHQANGHRLNTQESFTCRTALGRQTKVDKYTNANNYPIQGTAADILKLACVLLYEKCREEKLDAYIINYVHDEIVMEASEEHTGRAEEILKESMETAVNFVIKDFKTEVEIEK